MPLPLQQNEQSIRRLSSPSLHSEAVESNSSIEVTSVTNVDMPLQTEHRSLVSHLRRPRVQRTIAIIVMALLMFILASTAVTFPVNIIFYSMGSIIMCAAFASCLDVISTDNEEIDNESHAESLNDHPPASDYLPPSYESLGFDHSTYALSSSVNNEEDYSLPPYDSITVNSEPTPNHEDEAPPSYETAVSRFGMDLYIPPYNPNRRQQRIQFGSNLDNPQLSVPNTDISEQSSSVQSDQPSELDPEVLYSTQF